MCYFTSNSKQAPPRVEIHSWTKLLFLVPSNNLEIIITPPNFFLPFHHPFVQTESYFRLGRERKLYAIPTRLSFVSFLEIRVKRDIFLKNDKNIKATMKIASEVNIEATIQDAEQQSSLQIWNIPRFAKKNLRRPTRRIDPVIEIPRFDVNRIEWERYINIHVRHDIHLVRVRFIPEYDYRTNEISKILNLDGFFTSTLVLEKNNIIVSVCTSK